MQPIVDELHALALLIAANAVPVAVAQLARDRAALPLDFGLVMPDGERLFGAHKTWRGLLTGTAACALLAWGIGLPARLGAAFAALSLLADAVSSSVKRRLALKPGTEVPGLDQLGEALLPLLVFAPALSLSLAEVLLVTSVFIVLDVATARLRHHGWFAPRR